MSDSPPRERHDAAMEQLESKVDSCPTAPPYRVTVYIKVLHRACEKLGGVSQLAQALRVPPSKVLEWLEGVSEPPPTIFLKAVDIVMAPWGPADDEATRGYSRKRRKQ